LGIGRADFGAGSVTAIVVLNCLGDVRDPDSGQWLARTYDSTSAGRSGREIALAAPDLSRSGENTTIGVVCVSAAVDQRTLARCCVAAHDALARCVVPAHTLFDGDTFFAACPSLAETAPASTLVVQCAAELAVERAIVAIFRSASD